MFLVILLPFTYCLANEANETQPIPSTSTPSSSPQKEFFWIPPTSPTLWQKHPHAPFYRKPWRPPPPQFFPLTSPSFKYFPEYSNWIPSRRTPSFPHFHLRHPPPHRHHHHRRLPVPEISPMQKFLNVPFEREDESKPTPNNTETIELDSQVLGSMEKLISENLQTKVEIFKSIEMEYDPILKKFVQKRAEALVEPKHKKRSGETGLFTPQTSQNLQDVFKKFEQEQIDNQALVMRDKKNFQTGRFKFKQDVKIGNNANNSTKNLLQLICNVKKYGPNFIPENDSFDRFSRNANYYDLKEKEQPNRFSAETNFYNDSISVYVTDPNFFNFLHGNWSKGGIPIMLTAMSSNNGSKHCASC